MYLHVLDAFDGRLRAKKHMYQEWTILRSPEENGGNDHRLSRQADLLHSHDQKLTMTAMDDSRSSASAGTHASQLSGMANTGQACGKGSCLNLGNSLPRSKKVARTIGHRDLSMVNIWLIYG